MIYNMKPTVENRLHLSTFMFYPTGSVYLGVDTEESDKDFFTEDTPEVRKFLEDFGFNVLGVEDYYKDCLGIVDVYRLGKIDVQVVKGAEQKQMFQQKFHSVLFMMKNKLDRREFWKSYYSIGK